MHNKADIEYRKLINDILNNGTKDINPRPVWEDGTPAYTYSINHRMVSFDLSNGEYPILTLRPVPYKSAIKEILWIYQDQSSDLKLLRDKYNVKWWDEWDIGNDSIGACYGETVRRHNLITNLLNDIKSNPDGRRHIMSLWQDEDFKEPHGLKPCAFMTLWNVVHRPDGDYLDMMLVQRSVDSVLGLPSNWVQYAALLTLVSTSLGYKPGVFSWVGDNIQVYDRHIEDIKQVINRRSVMMISRLEIKEKKDFFDYTMDDINLIGYPLDEIKIKNPQVKFEIAR